MKNTMTPFINPLRDLGGALHRVQKPARYVGGELGANPPIAQDDQRFRIALCFPDLYEIGMSNNAIRLIYNELATMRDQIVCERVFAPAPDFEQELANRSIPLYTLESGIPLCQCDMIAFSVGYELLATNLLATLQAGHVPIRRQDRDSADPVVIAGGPAITNPHPFGLFLDAVYIGEAEAGFYGLLRRLAELKRRGGTRDDLLREIAALQQVWIPDGRPHDGGGSYVQGRGGDGGARVGGGELGDTSVLDKTARGGRVSRAVYSDFSTHAAFTAYPVAVLPTVQSHGSVEIMRGCPNGCRFCHAGFYYRPQRVKDLACIKEEVRSLVEDGGYREITLASLSSGDYPGIVDVFRALNAEWKDRRVSFQLPSLKVDTFTLPLLSELSEVRKSGLTFAVETPIESWQNSINKRVSLEKTLSILAEARAAGFRSAKFYFMIGLPVSGKGLGEADAICEFLQHVASQSRMSLNVTVGTFVPKPHTPYQRQGQLDEATALACIYRIKDNLRRYRSISVSYHAPFTSVLEGLICRGDDGVGGLVESAFQKGARLDAWEEYLNKDAWNAAMADYADTAGKTKELWLASELAERPSGTPLPWDDVSMNVSNYYYNNELTNSNDAVVTGPCSAPCDHPCGACNTNVQLVADSSQIRKGQTGRVGEIGTGEAVCAVCKEPSAAGSSLQMIAERRAERRMVLAARGFSVGAAHESTQDDRRLILMFRKQGRAAYYPLHSIPNVFARAFSITGVPVRFSAGFNPIPKMEFTSPLSLGFESTGEICAVWLAAIFEIVDIVAVRTALNTFLPSGLEVSEIRLGALRNQGKDSIGSLYTGAKFAIIPKNEAIAEMLAGYRPQRGNPYRWEWDSEKAEGIVFTADGQRHNSGGALNQALNQALRDKSGESPDGRSVLPTESKRPEALGIHTILSSILESVDGQDSEGSGRHDTTEHNFGAELLDIVSIQRRECYGIRKSTQISDGSLSVTSPEDERLLLEGPLFECL